MASVPRIIARRVVWLLPVLGAVTLFAQRMPGGNGAPADNAVETHGVRVTRGYQGTASGKGLLDGVGQFAHEIVPAGWLPGKRAAEAVTTENGVRVHRHH
ncbi:hypothetical protein [Novosphingobium cyanobacteriorum]|uniref:Secreted protein n=1 Tax=Novosphingobium cyanobacteriorum TaxID=3024215 RepID=A0ABT6CKC6_9SPHN|nr:hypothetical protein [Novosphingobium cyanobacteriorum]MDF8333964.1 hypothetical protein [Novosphingobium cyanobacteriorum]